MKGKNLQPRNLYPARLSFRFDGEIKNFPDKQKLREFSTTKPVLQQMLKKRLRAKKNSASPNQLYNKSKGTSLVRKHKRKKRPTQNKHKTVKKMVIGSCISIITLNVNELNAPTFTLRGSQKEKTKIKYFLK